MENLKKYWIAIVLVFIFCMFYKPVICFIIIGFFLLSMSIYYWIFLSNIQKNGIESVGKILHYESDYEGHKTPTIEFTTENGKYVLKKPFYYASTDLSKIRTYKKNIDIPISILYDPKNPDKFIIGKERYFNSFSLILSSLIGLIFLTIGICTVLGLIDIEF